MATIFTDDEDRSVTPPFTSYEELLTYFHRFLNREIETSPCDAFEEETELIQAQLLAINNAGILSFSSQPGTTLRSEEATYYQRSYLSCYMARELAHTLRAKLVPQGMIVLVEELHTLTEDDSELFDNFQEGCNNLEGSGLSREDVMEDDGAIAVTRVSFDDQSTSETQIVPGFNFNDLELMLENTSDEHQQIIKQDLVQVHFVDNEWGRETKLFDKLVEILVQ